MAMNIKTNDPYSSIVPQYPDGRVPTPIEPKITIGNLLDDLESQAATLGQYAEDLERIILDSGAGSEQSSKNPLVYNPGTVEGRLMILRERNRYALNLLDVLLGRM